MNVPLTIAMIGLLVFLAHVFAGLFSKTKVPDVVLLISIGLLVGPALGLVNTNNFGHVGPVFTTIALVIILFEGGLDLHLDALRRAFRSTLIMTSISFILTMAAVSIGAWTLTDLPISSAILLGAIVGSTSPAVVVPMAQALRMGAESRTLLSLESALSDVLSIVITFAIIEFITAGNLAPGPLAGHMIASFIFSAVIGGFAGLGWSAILERLRTIKNSMFTTPAFVFVLFGFVEVFHFSGYIAALVFGITLGNIKIIKASRLRQYLPAEPYCLNRAETVFFSEVVFLLKTFFFVYLGLSIRMTNLWPVIVGLILVTIVFVIRPFVALFSLNRQTARTDAVLIGVMAPKGLAAAALAGLPLQNGIMGGEIIQDLVYAIVLFSILMTSILVFMLEKTPLATVFGSLFRRYPVRPPDIDNEFIQTDNPTLSIYDDFDNSWGEKPAGDTPLVGTPPTNEPRP